MRTQHLCLVALVALGCGDSGVTPEDMSVSTPRDMRRPVDLKGLDLKGIDFATPPPRDMTMLPPPPDMTMPPSYTSAVTVFVEPDAGIGPIVDAIKGAKSSIDLTMYYLHDSSVISALQSACGAGRTVRVLLDPHPQQLSNSTAYSELQSAGCQVKYTSTQFTYTHEKAMGIDNKTIVVTTMNFDSAAVSSNREYGLVDTDPQDVAEYEEVFNADWNGTNATAVRLAVAPINARQRIDGLIATATHSIDIEWEELSDNDIGYRLQTKAQAGVTVRIIAPTTITGTATATMLKNLEAGGCQVRTLGNPSVHAKMVLVDGTQGFIGSENATSNSLSSNRELGVIWRNSSVASTCSSTFDGDWSSASPF